MSKNLTDPKMLPIGNSSRLGDNPQIDADEPDLTCSICDCLFSDPRVTPCGHTFCFACLTDWRGRSGGDACPLCRGRCPIESELPRNVCLAGLVDRRRAALMIAASGDDSGIGLNSTYGDQASGSAASGAISGVNLRVVEALLVGLLAGLSAGRGDASSQPLSALLNNLLPVQASSPQLSPTEVSPPQATPSSQLPPARPPPPRHSTQRQQNPPPPPLPAQTQATSRRSSSSSWEAKRASKRRAPPPPSSLTQSPVLRHQLQPSATGGALTTRLRRWALSFRRFIPS